MVQENIFNIFFINKGQVWSVPIEYIPIEEAKEQARVEGDRLKASAQAEIVQETNRAKEALRSQVATLALAGATKVLGSSVDAAKHSDLLNQLAQEL